MSPLLIVILIVFVDLIGFSIVMPLLPSLAHSRGYTDFQIGMIFAAYPACQLVAGPILGRLSDRFGRRPILAISQGGTALSFVILLGFRWALRGAPPMASARVNRWHALLPVGVYAASMAFTIANGSPIETRAIVVFAMGIPVLAALAAWRHWQADDGAVRGAAA